MKLPPLILFLLALCGCAGPASVLHPPTSIALPSADSFATLDNQSTIQPPPPQPPVIQLALALIWDEDPASAAFNVYYGTATHSYESMQAASTNRCVLTGLLSGAKYFFAVTALDADSIEGDYSKEFSAVFGPDCGRVARFYLPTSNSQIPSVEHSEDLFTWQPAPNCYPVATNSDSMDWFLPNAKGTMFYRLAAPINSQLSTTN